jgi:hypothetical protein
MFFVVVVEKVAYFFAKKSFMLVFLNTFFNKNFLLVRLYRNQVRVSILRALGLLTLTCSIGLATCKTLIGFSSRVERTMRWTSASVTCGLG